MQKSDLNNNICVLIMSCDSYEDLWVPFFHFFDKYWPDCPYPIFLATNTKLFIHNNVQVIHSNHFGTWSEETAIILNKLSFKNILYLQDDYFLLKKVDNLVIESLLTIFSNNNVNYLRLFPSPGPNKNFKTYENIGIINENALYRTSLQCAIWNKNTFLQLLISSENQWLFELNSVSRSNKLLFLSVKQQNKGRFKDHVYPITYYYLTAVLRGKWRWGTVKICKQEKVKLDFTLRKKETFFEMLYTNIYELLPVFFKKIIDFTINKLHK